MMTRVVPADSCETQGAVFVGVGRLRSQATQSTAQVT